MSVTHLVDAMKQARKSDETLPAVRKVTMRYGPMVDGHQPQIYTFIGVNGDTWDVEVGPDVKRPKQPQEIIGLAVAEYRKWKGEANAPVHAAAVSGVTPVSYTTDVPPEPPKVTLAKDMAESDAASKPVDAVFFSKETESKT